MAVYSPSVELSIEEWRKLGFKPLKGETARKHADKEWYTANQVVSLERPHTHPEILKGTYER